MQPLNREVTEILRIENCTNKIYEYTVDDSNLNETYNLNYSLKNQSGLGYELFSILQINTPSLEKKEKNRIIVIFRRLNFKFISDELKTIDLCRYYLKESEDNIKYIPEKFMSQLKLEIL